MTLLSPINETQIVQHYAEFVQCYAYLFKLMREMTGINMIAVSKKGKDFLFIPFNTHSSLGNVRDDASVLPAYKK